MQTPDSRSAADKTGETSAWGEIWEPLLENQAMLYTKYSIKEIDLYFL